MKIPTQRAPFFLGAAAALMLTFSTAAVYPQISQAADATPTTPGTAQATPDQAQGRLGLRGENEIYLAEALGITTDELQAAYLEAANAALDQAVEEDLLTQTQADTLRQRLEAAAENGFGGRGLGFGGRGMQLFGSDAIDTEALLADALGITVEALQTAYNDAQAAALAQAVSDGQLTQEQADLWAARQAFHDYVRSQQESYEDLVQAAVDAGAITQAQADLLLANQQSFGGRAFGGDFGIGEGGIGGRGMGGRGMGGHGMGGHGMRGGQDWGRGMIPGQDTQEDDSGAQSNSNFVFPSAGL
jgi:hypothetical protein